MWLHQVEAEADFSLADAMIVNPISGIEMKSCLTATCLKWLPLLCEHGENRRFDVFTQRLSGSCRVSGWYQTPLLQTSVEGRGEMKKEQVSISDYPDQFSPIFLMNWKKSLR